MVKRYYLTQIVGTGTDASPYRAAVGDEAMMSHATMIPSLPNGAPRSTWGLAVVAGADHTAASSRTDTDALPPTSLDTSLSTLSQQERKRVGDALARWGISVPADWSTGTLRTLILAIGQTIEPAFRGQLDVRDVS